jgi:hypothetical protein
MSTLFENFERELKLLGVSFSYLGQSSGESAVGRRARQGVERVEVGEMATSGPVGECVVCIGLRQV